jgi:predicted dehydrogenase
VNGAALLTLCYNRSVDLLRIGTLGSSRIAERALFEPASAVPGVTVAAVAARAKARAEMLALRHGIGKAYGGYAELLADPDIDAVYNPLPNSLHAPWTLAAIEAGKHVLCEKPFTGNSGQAARIADAAQASGLVVMEAMHYRYHPLIGRLREVVSSLGPVRHVQCWTSFVIENPDDIRYDYSLGGGALMDGGCYAIDFMRLFGEPSVTGALAGPYGPDPEVDQAMAVRLAFGDGATGWFESAFTSDGEFRADAHVICRDGHVWLTNFIFVHEGRLVARRSDGSVALDEQGSGETTYAWQLRAFAAAAGGGPPVPTSAEHAVTTMRLIDDAYQAAGLSPRC